MPVYEYKCPNGHLFEVIHGMTEPAPETCEVCGASPLQTVLHPVAVHYKGSGFYSTDYGRKKKTAAKDKDGGGSSSSDAARRATEGRPRRRRPRAPGRAPARRRRPAESLEPGWLRARGGRPRSRARTGRSAAVAPTCRGTSRAFAGSSSLGLPLPPPPRSPPSRQCTADELEARNFTQPSWTSCAAGGRS